MLQYNPRTDSFPALSSEADVDEMVRLLGSYNNPTPEQPMAEPVPPPSETVSPAASAAALVSSMPPVLSRGDVFRRPEALPTTVVEEPPAALAGSTAPEAPAAPVAALSPTPPPGPEPTTPEEIPAAPARATEAPARPAPKRAGPPVQTRENFIGEPVSYTPDPGDEGTPGFFKSIGHGAARGAFETLQAPVERTANAVEASLAEWTGNEWLKSTAARHKADFEKRSKEVEKEYGDAGIDIQAVIKDPSKAGSYIGGKMGELAPMLAGYMLSMPAMVVLGTLDGAIKAYEENNGDLGATAVGATVGGATAGAPIPFLRGAAGKSLRTNVTRAVVGMPLITTATQMAEPLPKWAAGGGYDAPTWEKLADATAGAVVTAPFIGAHGYYHTRGTRGKPGEEKPPTTETGETGETPPAADTTAASPSAAPAPTIPAGGRGAHTAEEDVTAAILGGTTPAPPARPVAGGTPETSATTAAVDPAVVAATSEAVGGIDRPDLGMTVSPNYRGVGREGTTTEGTTPTETAGSFTTSRGSTYEIHDDGTTTRNKSYHPEHGPEDVGEKPRSEHTFYVADGDAARLAAPSRRENGGDWAVVPDHENGVAHLLTRPEGGEWGWSSRDIPISREPQEGMVPVELWDKRTVAGKDGKPTDTYGQVHFGNNITEVGGRKTAAEPITEKVAPTEIAGPKTVAEYADDYLAGRGRDSSAHEQFAANNAPAIEAEFARRKAEADAAGPGVVDRPDLGMSVAPGYRGVGSEGGGVTPIAGEPAAATAARAVSKGRARKGKATAVEAEAIAPVAEAAAAPAPAPAVPRAKRGKAAAATTEAPAAAQEAVAKSKAKSEAKAAPVETPAAEAAVAASKSQTATPLVSLVATPRTERAAPTTVVKRPTKRTEVVIGRRGEGAVAQGETPAAAEAIAKSKAKQPVRESRMAEDVARDVEEEGAKTPTKAKRATPTEELGEGMQIEDTADTIAETRSEKTTDKNLTYNDHLHDVLSGNTDLATAAEAVGTKAKGTRGRPRRNADFADYLDKEVIPRAEKNNQADLVHMQKVAEALKNKSPAQRDKILDKLGAEMEARVRARGKTEIERANLDEIKRMRDQLRGKGEGTGDSDAPMQPTGKRANPLARLFRQLKDGPLNKRVQDRLDASDRDNRAEGLHDYLRDIANDPAVKAVSPDLAELARHYIDILPDIETHSFRRLGESLEAEGQAKRGAEIKAKENTAGGSYLSSEDVIGLNPKQKGQVETILHEATHGGTAHYLEHLAKKVKNNEPLTPLEAKHNDTLEAITTELRNIGEAGEVNLDSLFDNVKGAGAGGAERSIRTSAGEAEAVRYALEGSGRTQAIRDRAAEGHEIVAMVMTSPTLRGLLARTPSSDGLKQDMRRLGYKGKIDTVWQAFKTFVGDVLGVKKNSILDQILDPVTDIVSEGARFRQREAIGMPSFDSPLRRSGGRERQDRLATDALPSERARAEARPMGEAFHDMAPMFSREGATQRGLGAVRTATRALTRGALTAAPTHKIAEWNEDVVPAGQKIKVALKDAYSTSGKFQDRWGDRIQSWARQLKSAPGVAKLMNDASMARTYATNDPTLHAERNAHLNADERKIADGIRDRYNALTPEGRQLYDNVRDYYRRTHWEERQLEYQDVVKRFLPDATPDQVAALGEQVKTKRGIKELIANPDVLADRFKTDAEKVAGSDAAKGFAERWQNSRALMRDIGKLQDAGWVDGDYFPLRRYGDWVVKYGEMGDKDYGVEMFERRGEADARREELIKQLPKGTQIGGVISKRANPGYKEFAPESVFEDMQRAMTKRGASSEEIEQAKEAYGQAMMRRMVSQGQAQARMRRNYVEGASTDASRTLLNNFLASAARVGHLTHGAELSEAFKEARRQVKGVEDATGTAGTKEQIATSQKQLDALEARFKAKDPAVAKEDVDHARQQHEWLRSPPSSADAVRARAVLNEFEARRGRVESEGNDLLGRTAGTFTKASFVYHLIRPMHLALQVADAHANAQSLMGADYGHGRTAVALARAMRDLAPTGYAKGLRNAVRAVQGEMQHSDWHYGDAMLKKLIGLKPGDAAHEAEMRALHEESQSYGIVDHTQSREIRRMATHGGFDVSDLSGGKVGRWTNVHSNMMNLFAVGEHTVDATNRMAILKAGYDLARSRGANPAAARKEALTHAMDAMPVYGAWNTPRIATSRAPVLHDLAPATMQYKLYGMHMYSVMGGLVRQAMTRPAERAEAVKALTGLVATHSLLGGVTGSLFALPVVAALGAWDMFSGKEKPHNYETDLKQWIAEISNPEIAKFASSGLFGLAGAQQQRSLKLTNMVDVPELKSFNSAGVGQWIVQAMTGASGAVAEQLFEGMHELTTGNYSRAAKLMLPRVLSDPFKAMELGEEGVVDKRGRTILAPHNVSTGAQIVQALGGNPYEVALARERRFAGQSNEDEVKYQRQLAIDRYTRSGGRDMSGVRSYMQDEQQRRMSPIKFHELQQALKEERGRASKPQFYGAQVPKKAQMDFVRETRFY